MSQLLIDYLPLRISPQQINESLARNNGLLVLEGVIQKANTKNGNGRVYPRPVLEEAMNQYQDLIRNGNACGELDHTNESQVNLKNASHKITKVWWDGDDVCGRIEVLTTPMGNIVKELLKCGVNVGISSRAVGSVRNLGETLEVEPGLVITTFDLVSTPSTPGAFMNRINEGLAQPAAYRYARVNQLITGILSQYN